MSKGISIVFGVIMIAIFACSKQRFKSYKDIKEFAVFVWNEDTVNKTVLALRNNQQFALFMTKQYNGEAKTISYEGKYTDRDDTIWLDYRKNKKPEGVTNYLLREMSDSYFIQPYTDNRPRMFLRIVKPPVR